MGEGPTAVSREMEPQEGAGRAPRTRAERGVLPRTLRFIEHLISQTLDVYYFIYFSHSHCEKVLPTLEMEHVRPREET